MGNVRGHGRRPTRLTRYIGVGPPTTHIEGSISTRQYISRTARTTTYLEQFFRPMWINVSAGYLRVHDMDLENDRINQLREKGKIIAYVVMDDGPEGAIAPADVIREESRQALSDLRDKGIQVIMLTGDSKGVAVWVAEELGLDDYFAEVLPDEKAIKIKEVKERGLTVAMVMSVSTVVVALNAKLVGTVLGNR